MRINCLRAKMVCNESKNYSRKCSATLLNVGLMVVLFVFAKLTTVTGKDIRVALMTLLWFSLI